MRKTKGRRTDNESSFTEFEADSRNWVRIQKIANFRDIDSVEFLS